MTGNKPIWETLYYDNQKILMLGDPEKHWANESHIVLTDTNLIPEWDITIRIRVNDKFAIQREIQEIPPEEIAYDHDKVWDYMENRAIEIAKELLQDITSGAAAAFAKL